MTKPRVDHQRYVTVHIPVPLLKLPEPLRVGRVTFRPAGWLDGHAEQIPALGTPRHIAASGHRHFLDPDTATAEVHVRISGGERAELAAGVEAREIVRDAAAVLRFYQVARYRRHDARRQTFGLADEVGSAMQHFWVLRGRRFIASGSSWHGQIAPWGFGLGDAATFRADPVFAYLGAALRTTPGRRNQFERRALNAVRTYSLALLQHRVSLQVVLLATALEALLGDEPDPKDPDRTERGGYLRIAQRAAYLWCGADFNDPYPGRAACFRLEAKTLSALIRAFNDRVGQGQRPVCTYFGSLMLLLDDRHEALHRQREQFPQQDTNTHPVTAEEVIVHCLRWIVANRATRLRQLDVAIERLRTQGPVRPAKTRK